MTETGLFVFLGILLLLAGGAVCFGVITAVTIALGIATKEEDGQEV